MENKKLIEQIKKLFSSGKKEEIFEAIELINEHNVPGFLQNLCQTFSSSTDDEVKLKISELLNNNKQSNSIPEFTKLLNSDFDIHTMRMVVSSAWQCGLDFSNHLESFIPLLLSADFELAFEAYTVVESNIDFMTKQSADNTRTLLKGIEDKLSEKLVLLYEGLMERLDSVS